METVRVDPAEAAAALAALDPELRAALETAAVNIRAVAEAQLGEERTVELPQGHSVRLREVPVGAAGLYAPGGRAAYPSSVLMTALPAQAAGVGRIALATPPGPDGRVHPVTLAAAALCGIEEIYAIGGAQAIFALAYGTESITPVDVVAGPGNSWVQEAKRSVYGTVGIDSLAGPSELMIIAGHDTEAEWAAFDLCAQAEHGEGGAGRRGGRGARPRRGRRGDREARRAASRRLRLGAAGARPRARLERRGRPLQRLRARARRDLRGGRERPRRPDHHRGLRLRRPLGGDRVRRLRGGVEPRAADRRLRPLHRAARPGRLPPADLDRRDRPRGGRGAGPERRRDRPAPRDSPSTRIGDDPRS